MGIRSERFQAGEADKNQIQVKVEVIEMLGKEQLLYCLFPNGQPCVISEPGHFRYAADEDHNFHLDIQGLHFLMRKRLSGLTSRLSRIRPNACLGQS